MTGPVGEVRADLVVTTDKTEKTLRDSLEALDRDIEETGDLWGEALADGLNARLKKEAPNVTDAFSAELARRPITGMTFELDSDGNVRRRWIRTGIVEPLERTIREQAALPGGGIFKPVGQALSDAVGAGFNISGRSPLIALLIPLLGYIVALVTGAIQAVNGLLALILTIPMAITALLIQGGILMAAFEGVGSAIKGAFSAENAEELDKALEKLTDSAKSFVRELLTLKPILGELQKISQESFFKGFMKLDETPFGSSIDKLREFLESAEVRLGVARLAEGLGTAFDILVRALSHPAVKSFIIAFLPSISRWVVNFAGAIAALLTGVSSLSESLIPFFNWVGDNINEGISDLGGWLSGLAEDPEFKKWLDDAKQSLKELGNLIDKLTGFLTTLLNKLNEAGGNNLIRTLADQFEFLSEWLDSPEGTKSLEGLLHLLEGLSWMFIALIAVIIALLFVFEIMGEFIKNGLGPAIMWFFRLVGDAILWVKDRFVEFFEWLGLWLVSLWNDVDRKTRDGIASFLGAIVNGFMQVMGFIGSFPEMILNVLGSLGNLMFTLGKNIIQGLINGMLSMLGPLGGALGFIAGKIVAHLPQSPAEEGPLSGRGDPLYAGQTIVERLATGMEMEAPRLADASSTATSNINFGAGAFQLNFYGTPPSQQQATSIGTGLGNGVSNILAQRDTRLAIRAMG